MSLSTFSSKNTHNLWGTSRAQEWHMLVGLDYEQDTVTNVYKSGDSWTEEYIIKLLGRPIMTEEERLYRKIRRRRPAMLKLAAAYGLLCE